MVVGTATFEPTAYGVILKVRWREHLEEV